MYRPEHAQAQCKTQAWLDIALLLTPVERDSTVVVLTLEAVEQDDLVRAVQLRLHRFQDAHVEQGMPSTYGCALAARVQMFERKLADSLEHGVPGTPLRVFVHTQET